jgi:hypothetical protein
VDLGAPFSKNAHDLLLMKRYTTKERIERTVKNTKAHLIVQHDPQDFQALPKFPAYLD